MVRLLSIGIDVFASMVILLPVMAVLQFAFFKDKDLRGKILSILFAVYLAAVFSAVGIPAVNSLAVDFSFNWIPIMDITDSPAEYMKNTVLNILLFVPLGFLLPSLWKEYRSLKKTIFMGLGLSFMIELLQIFTYRLTDVDDLLTNTMGAMAGYILAKIFAGKRFHGLALSCDEFHHRYEPFVISAIVFLVMFIPRPFISNGIWEFVLSSSLWESLK